METLGRAFVRVATKQRGTFCMADSTGQELTFGRALIGSLLISRIVRKRTPDEELIGLLLPASVGGALANIATSLAGKVSVNLNFTSGHDAMASAIERCGIRTILTSRMFLAKAGIETLPGMLYLEDLVAQTSSLSKAAIALATTILPAGLINRLFVHEKDADSLATVIFSSGSTGVPKGVMLSHHNVQANIASSMQVFELGGRDVMLGVLPFFHSFGFTVTLWLPLVSGFAAVYHPNPMDAKTIGDLAHRYRGTVLISTPTFCLAYVRKTEAAHFAHLRYAVVGAERLRDPIALAFKEKFGVDLTEGYGCTEMAPVVAANLSPSRRGSVGRPLPGVDAKVVDAETGEGPLVGTAGLLLVSGPNRMIGYLGEPERTRDAFRGDWYVTADMAAIDADGFIFITDRLSRFSKIAGEMVPHMKIEEEIQAILGEPHACVVTSMPDDVKGERLVAFYTDPDLTPQELWDRLSATALPKLWIPKRDDLRPIDAVPTLGTGKTDLPAVRQLALKPKLTAMKE
jgi:acyl-[acyl-carrier-protein]-phospholipid O-acyltransferase/long-chain-fatty-acid--[acyl-carrier-protein] ligase